MFHSESMVTLGAPKTRRSSVSLDPTSLTPSTLIAARVTAEDPRLSKKGYSDDINDVLPPMDNDPVSISRYARYCAGAVRDLQSRISANHKPAEPAKSAEPAKLAEPAKE